jgi:hypothetical protein
LGRPVGARNLDRAAEEMRRRAAFGEEVEELVGPVITERSTAIASSARPRISVTQEIVSFRMPSGRMVLCTGLVRLVLCN